MSQGLSDQLLRLLASHDLRTMREQEQKKLGLLSQQKAQLGIVVPVELEFGIERCVHTIEQIEAELAQRERTSVAVLEPATVTTTLDTLSAAMLPFARLCGVIMMVLMWMSGAGRLPFWGFVVGLVVIGAAGLWAGPRILSVYLDTLYVRAHWPHASRWQRTKATAIIIGASVVLLGMILMPAYLRTR